MAEDFGVLSYALIWVVKLVKKPIEVLLVAILLL